jgi:hypothetical protein
LVQWPTVPSRGSPNSEGCPEVSSTSLNNRGFTHTPPLKLPCCFRKYLFRQNHSQVPVLGKAFSFLRKLYNCIILCPWGWGGPVDIMISFPFYMTSWWDRHTHDYCSFQTKGVIYLWRDILPLKKLPWRDSPV